MIFLVWELGGRARAVGWVYVGRVDVGLGLYGQVIEDGLVGKG